MDFLREGGERGAFVQVGRTWLAFLRKWLFRAADHGIGAVNGLEYVEVKLFSARHPDIESVLLDRVVDAFGILRQDLLRAFKGRIVQRRSIDRPKNGLLCFRQGVSGT